MCKYCEKHTDAVKDENVKEYGEVRQELLILEDKLEDLHVQAENIERFIEPILSVKNKTIDQQTCERQECCTDLGDYINSLRTKAEIIGEYFKNIMSRIEL